MMVRMLLTVLLTVAGTALAAEALHPSGLLSAQIARPLLEQDPAVSSARAGLEVARQEAGILEKSPYEWTTKVSGQRRALSYPDNSADHNEWNIGIERTIRLPGKAVADGRIGSAAIKEAQARYGEAMHEAARELVGLWVEWLTAEQSLDLAVKNLQSIQESLAAVEKRARAGDASKLDLSIARAELAEQQRLHNDAKTQASAAWQRVSTRFPGLPRQVSPLPSPLPIAEDTAFWSKRILAESDVLKVVQAQLTRAQAQIERVRADKVPDPTFGAYTASEMGGREHISGITFSIPIPGGIRDSRHAKAIAEADVLSREVELKKRQLETDIASAVATARGAYESLQIANEGAAAMQENAALMQRAYALGEADLQALLLARRQTTAAMNNALQARVVALMAYYGLLVDAHFIWGLEHD